MKPNKLLLIGISLLLILGCGESKTKKTKLKITVDKSCMNLVLNNQVKVKVEKVGGGYNGEFTVQSGDLGGTTIELPSGGTYNVKGYGKDTFLGTEFFGKEWGGSVEVQENSTQSYNLWCR